MTLGLAETERFTRAQRIVEDAKRAPIVLARRIVQQHIANLRERGVITAKPDDVGLLLARESLEHEVAAAILDARMAPR